MQNRTDIPRGKLKTPYINSKYILPLLIVIALVVSFTYNKQATMGFITNENKINDSETIITSINKEKNPKVYNYLLNIEGKTSVNEKLDAEGLLSKYHEDETKYASVVAGFPIKDSVKYESGLTLFKHKIPMWIFLIVVVGLAFWAYKENLSLIPLLGLVCCFYMMAELSLWNWIYFTVWLLIGMIIYFT